MTPRSSMPPEIKAGSSRPLSLLRSVERAAIRALVAATRIVPITAFYVSGWILGNLFYAGSRGYRRLLFHNLDLAYGNELSRAQKRRIARGSVITFLQEALIVLKLSQLRSWDVVKMVEIEHEERLKDAMLQGRGVALVTGHLSNFSLAVARLVRVGYRVGVLRRRAEAQASEELFDYLMTSIGIRNFYHKETLLPLARFLKDGGAVLFTIDQNARRGVQVPFFGIPAATFTAPVRFALGMNAVTLPIFMHRERWGRYVLSVEEPVELGRDKSDKAVYDNLLKLSLVLEKYVRKYPDQWLWLHRRWRHVSKRGEAAHSAA